MATVTAVKNGNWSDTTVWSTGALPTTADDVESGVYTVQMDVSATVLSVKNTAGGTFNLLGGVTLTATGSEGFFPATTTTLITYSQSNPATSTLIGAIRNNQYSNVVVFSGSGTLNIQGNVTGGWQNKNTSSNYSSVYKSGNGILNIVGNLGQRTSSSTGNGPSLIVASSTSGSVNITGDVVDGGAYSNKGGIYIRSSGCPVNITGSVSSVSTDPDRTFNCVDNNSSTVTIIGNVTGSFVQNIWPINNTNSSGVAPVLNITGNVIGGNASSTGAITMSSNGTINITGSVSNPGAYYPAINTYTTSGVYTVNVNGPITASLYSPAITGVTYASVTGPLIGASNGTVALLTYFMTWHPSSTPATYMTAVTSDVFGNVTGYRNLYTTDYGQTGHPTTGNVRLGTVYGPSNENTGTMAVPLPSQVIAGVAVDVPPTVGSASLDPSALWNIQLSTLTVPGSIGERLKNLITTDVVASQLKDAITYNG